MDTKSIQFTAYDFLGYLVPGLALFALIDCSFAFHAQHMALSYEAITCRYQAVSLKAAIPLALISYFIGHLISFVSSMTIERYARWRYGHPMKFLLDDSAEYPSFFQAGGKSICWSKVLRSVTAFALAPIFIFESVLLVTGILRNYIRSMGPDLASVVKNALAWLRNKAGMISDPSKDYPSEFESLAINYTLECAPSHIFTLRNYVVLYGFLRSMTLVLVLTTWAVSLHVAGLVWAKEKCPILAFPYLFVGVLAGGFICSISYGAYLKFWTRYNKEALMGLTAVYLKEQFSNTNDPINSREKS